MDARFGRCLASPRFTCWSRRVNQVPRPRLANSTGLAHIRSITPRPPQRRHLRLDLDGWGGRKFVAYASALAHRVTGARWAVWGAVLWNAGVAIGLLTLALGGSEGQEWLEFPWPVDLIFGRGWSAPGRPTLADSGSPSGGTPLRLDLVYWSFAAVVSLSVHSCQPSPPLHRSFPSDCQLVVRPQRFGLVDHSDGSGRRLLLHPEGVGRPIYSYHCRCWVFGV